MVAVYNTVNFLSFMLFIAYLFSTTRIRIKTSKVFFQLEQLINISRCAFVHSTSPTVIPTAASGNARCRENVDAKVHSGGES